MKIFMALMGLDIGGAETHVVELAKCLTRQGHTVIVASNGGAYVPSLEASGIRHYPVPMHLRDPRLMAKALRRLKTAIRQENPDLVHAHARIPALLCKLAQRSLHFPLITTAHWVFEVTPLLRLITTWGDRCVAVSEDIKTYLMENYEYPLDQIHVTINGIDTEAFSPDQDYPQLREALGLTGGPIIGLVSRLDESRALAARVLIRIAPRLAQVYPGIQLLIVGGGDQESTLRQEAAAVNESAGRSLVVMTGSRTDIPELVAISDVFVGVSRAALEAMAAGKPVILAGNEGYMGLFTPEKQLSAQQTNFCLRGSQMIFEDSLYGDLCATLALDAAARREIGLYGRRLILEQYSVERMTADYLKAYDALLHPVTPVRATISGYYGYDNLGDDAILQTISRQLSEMSPPIQLTVLSRNPARTRSRFGLRAIPRFGMLGVIRSISRSDLLISGGGSLIQDRTSTRSILYYLSVIGIAQHLKKPVFLYANGVGPITRNRNRRFAGKILSKCTAITLRDTDSLRELVSLGLSPEKLTVTGDPAFLLSRDVDGARILAEAGIPGDRPVIGISVRKTAGIDNAIPGFAALCDRIHQELHSTVVFIVMQEPYDRDISQQIIDRMHAPGYLLATPNHPEAMIGAIGKMELVLSLRLHTIIFAARARVPVVGCVYDPKVSAFLSMLQMPDCGTPEHFDPDRAYEEITKLLADRAEVTRKLDEVSTELELGAGNTPLLLGALLRREQLI